MESWKQALWLAKFELNGSKKGIITTVLTFIVFFLFIVYTFEKNKDAELLSMTYDIFFGIVFWFSVAWSKPKEFQYQKLARDFWGSPYFIMLKQLPIPEEILIRSRFLQYYVISIPIHLLFLIMFFLSSASIRTLLSPGEYIAFSLIWLSSGIGIGSIFPASDSGDNVSPKKLVMYFVVTFTVFIGGFSLLYLLSGEGLVYWTIIAADRWPLLSAIISIFVAGLCLNYWPRYMKRNIERIDYYK